jgi:transcriptional regulator with XRE-family HTH domain
MSNGEYLKEMGKKIKAARNAKGLYLRDLGKLCSLDYGTLSRIENGQFNSYLLTLKNIADKLEVDIKDFL